MGWYGEREGLELIGRGVGEGGDGELENTEEFSDDGDDCV